MKRLASVAVLLIVSLAGVPARAQTDSSPLPYIYYYAEQNLGLIVERADGSDRFLVPFEPGCHLSSWSPSGRWMLEYCDDDDPATAGRALAVSLAGDPAITTLALFDDFPTAPTFRWSPTGEDRLLVRTLFSPRQPGGDVQAQPGLYVIDFSQDRLVLEKTFEDFPECAEWSPDGRFIAARPCTDDPTALIIPAAGSEPPVVAERAHYQSNVWTPDGRLLTHLTASAELLIEDPAGGAALTLPFSAETSWPVRWSADGQHAFIYTDSTLWLLGLADGTLQPITDEAVAPRDVEVYYDTAFGPAGWSPDGRRALFASEDGWLRWLYPDGSVREIADIPASTGIETVAKMVQWGGHYAFIRWNQTTYIYDLDADQVVTTFAQTTRYWGSESPLEFTVSPDGRFLAWIGGCEMIPMGACVWDWAAQTGVRIMPHPEIEEFYETTAGNVRWHPAGGVIYITEEIPTAGPGTPVTAIASADGRVYRPTEGIPSALPAQIDPATLPHAGITPLPALALTILAHNSTVGVVSWSPDGRWLASAPTDFVGHYTYVYRGGHEVRVWDAASGAKVGEFPLEKCSMGAIYAPPGQDGLQLASYAAQDNGYSGYITALDWPRTDGSTALALLLNECDDRYRLLIWDWAAGQVVAEYEDVTAAAFAPGGEQIALGYADGRIVLTAYPDIDPADVIATLPTAVDVLTFSADGSRLAAASLNTADAAGELTAFDLPSAAPTFTVPRPDKLRGLALATDGSTIAVATHELLFCSRGFSFPTLLDGQSGEALSTPNPDLYAVTFSPDGRYLAAGGCGTAIWEATSQGFVSITHPIGRSLAWNPDGSQLAVAASYGIFVWNLP